MSKRDEEGVILEGSQFQLRLAILDDAWRTLENRSLVTFLKPGCREWLGLIGIFQLPSTTSFQIGIAASPGSLWSEDQKNFALELVRVLPDPYSRQGTPPRRSRARVFRFAAPITLDNLAGLDPVVVDRPCIELLRIEDEVLIDVRGLQYVDTPHWEEEISLLLKGARLISGDESKAEAQIKYESEIVSAIERMAQQVTHDGKAPKFTMTALHAYWPFRISRAHLYNLITAEQRDRIEARYYRRWIELHSST
jgi:hypothetical protein